MKTSKNTITVLVIALVIGIAHFANATVRNFTFSGVITEFFALEGPPPGLPLPNLAVPGDPFTGTACLEIIIGRKVCPTGDWFLNIVLSPRQYE
jgi:hypothetical protein